MRSFKRISNQNSLLVSNAFSIDRAESRVICCGLRDLTIVEKKKPRPINSTMAIMSSSTSPIAKETRVQTSDISMKYFSQRICPFRSIVGEVFFKSENANNIAVHANALLLVDSLSKRRVVILVKGFGNKKLKATKS